MVKDLLMLVVYLMPFFSRTITWRGCKIRIGKYTLLTFNQKNLLHDDA